MIYYVNAHNYHTYLQVTHFDPEFGAQYTLWYITEVTPVAAVGYFEIDILSGEIKSTSPLDFEETATQNVTLTLRAEDTGVPKKSSTNNVTVYIRNINEPPTVPVQNFNINGKLLYLYVLSKG